ncbi:kinase [Marinobacter halodurans]|uniref:kinase n=1 Tax=Marinobacter halodurans TaxID=2528979 RepID=UPI001A956086|nr:kinase [Marinobacter halodurans]
MPQDERRYSIRALFIVAFVAILGTVLALETVGLIAHTRDKDKVQVGDFRAIYVGPREDYRMSPKPSELHAECYDGYLAVGSDTDVTLKGVLVDYRNRGIRCTVAPRPPQVAPEAPNPDTSPETGGSDEQNQ